MITCPCNHCNNVFELEPEHVGSKVICPKCGMETILFRPTTPAVTQIRSASPPPPPPATVPPPANPGPSIPQIPVAINAQVNLTMPDRPILIRTAKSRGIYIILGIFLGALGVHNFYAGYYARGAVKLALMVVFTNLLVGAFVAIWAIAEIITTKTDANGDPLV